MRGCRALLVLLTAVLVLAGCGASRTTAPTGATLAAEILHDGGFWTDAKVSCTEHACNMAWTDRVFDARSAWLGASPEVLSIRWDDRLKSIRQFNLRIDDYHSQREAAFTCDLRHKMRGNSTGPRPSDLGCVETERKLA